ncbi:MAG: ATP-dependent metallopeptidase FtsH/Yme1/Tma family protein [Chitinophagaceae bacterium]
MSPNEPRNTDRKSRSRRDDNLSPRKGPKFNIYWIWAIIFALLVGFQLFGDFVPEAKRVDSWKEVRDEMLGKGDVDKLVIVTNKNLVRVYIKKDSLVKKYYQDKFGRAYDAVKSTDGPHFEFQSQKYDEFVQQLKD